MGSEIVVILPPFFYNVPGMFHTEKPVDIQALVPESSVKAFDISILNRFARTDEIQLHLVSICPFIQDTPGKFGTVIDGNCPR
jgi:hypothetical protein